MFIKLCNLGRDAELKYTAGGKAVCNLALAYSIGWGGNKKTQWIDGTLWGDRAEKMASMLTKGKQLLITADDVELETYPKNDGTTGAKLKCRIIDIEFAGGRPAEPRQSQGQPAQQRPTPQQAQQQQAAPQGQGFDDFSDDIGF